MQTDIILHTEPAINLQTGRLLQLQLPEGHSQSLVQPSNIAGFEDLDKHTEWQWQLLGAGRADQIKVELTPEGWLVQSCLVKPGCLQISLGEGMLSIDLPVGLRTKATASADLIKLLTWIKSQQGKPYVWGAEGPNGYDCSGLVQTAWLQIGRRLPRTVVELAKVAAKVESALPGDLVFFSHDGKKLAHVGVVTQVKAYACLFWHASSSKGVREDNLTTSNYWRSRFKQFGRL